MNKTSGKIQSKGLGAANEEQSAVPRGAQGLSANEKRTAAVVAGLIFGTSINYLYKTLNVGDSYNNLSELQAVSPYPDVSSYSRQVNRTIIEKGTPAYKYLADYCGLDVETLNDNFYMDVQVPNENGPCIVHIGQLHRKDQAALFKDKDSEEEVRSVVNIQRHIYNALINMRQKGAYTLYSEGIFTGPDADPLAYLNLVKRIMGTELTTEGLDGLLKRDYGGYFVAASSANNGRAMAYLNYTFQQKWPDIDGAIKSGQIDPNSEAASIYHLVRDTFVQQDIGLLTKEDLLYYGADTLAISENVFSNVVPIEEEDLVNRQIKAIKTYNDLVDVYNKAKSDSKLREELQLACEAANKRSNTANYARQNGVVWHISKSWTQEMGKVLPLVMGDSHNFTGNVLAHNDSVAEGGTQLGLVKLTPKIMPDRQ